MEQGAAEPRRFWNLTERVIGACIEVHRLLGPGVAYDQCLARELALRGLRFEMQRPLPLTYKGMKLLCGYRLDFVVEGQVILEIKAVESLLPVHAAQVITYLRLTNIPIGLLVNFHTESIMRGVRRFVLTPKSPSPRLRGSL